MNRLISIIGPAPSEIPFNDLLKKVQLERVRVREALIAFREKPPTTSKPRKAKPKGKAKASRIPKRQVVENIRKVRQAGLSMEDILLTIEKLQGDQKGETP